MAEEGKKKGTVAVLARRSDMAAMAERTFLLSLLGGKLVCSRGTGAVTHGHALLQAGWSGGSSSDQSRHLRRLAKGGVSTLEVMCTCLGRRSRSRCRRRRMPPAPAELAEVALRPLRRRRRWLTASAQRPRRGARQLTGYRPAFLEGEPTRLTTGEKGPRALVRRKEPAASAVRRSIQRRRFVPGPLRRWWRAGTPCLLDLIAASS